MIESHVGKDKRGNQYHAMLFREVYTFINEAPETMLSLFEKYINNEDNEDALELIEKFLHIKISKEVKDEFIKYVSPEHDVDWHANKDWDLVEGKQYNPKNAFIPREQPYGVDVNKGKAKKYWKSTKNKPLEQTGVESKIKDYWLSPEDVKDEITKGRLKINYDEYEKLYDMQVKCYALWDGTPLTTEQVETLKQLDVVRTTLHGEITNTVIKDNDLDVTKGIYDSVRRGIALMMEEDYKHNKKNNFVASALKPGATIDNIHEAMGAASAIFMSNPLPGTKQVMPSEELNEIASKTIETLENKINALQDKYMKELNRWSNAVDDVLDKDTAWVIELEDTKKILSDLFSEVRINLYAKKDKRVIVAKAKHFATEHIQPIATEIINLLVEKLNLDNYSLDGRLIEEEIDTILQNYLEGYYMFESDWFQKKHR